MQQCAWATWHEDLAHTHTHTHISLPWLLPTRKTQPWDVNTPPGLGLMPLSLHILDPSTKPGAQAGAKVKLLINRQIAASRQCAKREMGQTVKEAEPLFGEMWIAVPTNRLPM